MVLDVGSCFVRPQSIQEQVSNNELPYYTPRWARYMGQESLGYHLTAWTINSKEGFCYFIDCTIRGMGKGDITGKRQAKEG